MRSLREEMALGEALRAAGQVRGRYAPSPTGALHFGNLRTGLLAWLHARCFGGVCILRVEDLDQQRCKEGFEAQMLDDLELVGLDFDEGVRQGGPCAPYRQSERLPLYDEALEALTSRGLAYPCYCTRKEIHRDGHRSSSGELVYGGRCLRLSEAERARLSRTRQPAWRFHVGAPEVESGAVSFRDGIKGRVSSRGGPLLETVQDVGQQVGDFIIRRRDGVFSYQLAVVIDDICMGVTDVVRGEDLYLNTPRQMLLYEAFEARAPRFWHVPLVLDEEGKKLSKRDRAHGIHGVCESTEQSVEEVWGDVVETLGWVKKRLACTPHSLFERLSCGGAPFDAWKDSMGELTS